MSQSQSASEADTQIGFLRLLVAGALFIIGLFFLLGGLIPTVLVALNFLKTTWAHLPIHPLGGRLILAYFTMACSGVAWCLASVFCVTLRTKKAVLAVAVAVLLWGLFFVIFPGPIPLEQPPWPWMKH